MELHTQYCQDINSPVLIYKISMNQNSRSSFLFLTDKLILKFLWKYKGPK